MRGISAGEAVAPRDGNAEDDSTVTKEQAAVGKGTRSIMITDTARTGINRRNFDKNALKVTPKYVHKEKMEKPWPGGMLKDIIFR